MYLFSWMCICTPRGHTLVSFSSSCGPFPVSVHEHQHHSPPLTPVQTRSPSALLWSRLRLQLTPSLRESASAEELKRNFYQQEQKLFARLFDRADREGPASQSLSDLCQVGSLDLRPSGQEKIWGFSELVSSWREAGTPKPNPKSNRLPNMIYLLHLSWTPPQLHFYILKQI